MGKAKYKVGDVVQIKPGISISEYEKKSDDNTFGVITDVFEYNCSTLDPDYGIDLSLNGPLEVDCDSYYQYFDERYIAGYADKFYKEEDIHAEEICFLL